MCGFHFFFKSIKRIVFHLNNRYEHNNVIVNIFFKEMLYGGNLPT